MIRTVTNIFLKGLVAFVPLFLTVYILAVTIKWLNQITNVALNWFSPGLTAYPGAGIAIAAAMLFILGLIVSSRFTSWLFKLIETPLRTLPFVKDIYGALRQFSELFTPKENKHVGKVVKISHPSVGGSMIGLLMRQEFSDMPQAMQEGDNVAVYLPMGYQIGGFTVFVPQAWVTEIDMGVETALRNTLMGWAEEQPAA